MVVNHDGDVGVSLAQYHFAFGEQVHHGIDAELQRIRVNSFAIIADTPEDIFNLLSMIPKYVLMSSPLGSAHACSYPGATWTLPTPDILSSSSSRRNTRAL